MGLHVLIYTSKTAHLKASPREAGSTAVTVDARMVKDRQADLVAEAVAEVDLVLVPSLVLALALALAPVLVTLSLEQHQEQCLVRNLALSLVPNLVRTDSVTVSELFWIPRVPKLGLGLDLDLDQCIKDPTPLALALLQALV
jgi:hypothetical protein